MLLLVETAAGPKIGTIINDKKTATWNTAAQLTLLDRVGLRDAQTTELASWVQAAIEAFNHSPTPHIVISDLQTFDPCLWRPDTRPC